ncbi:hypothetical protein FKM82_006444 [Ascaphus truei]
MEDPEPGSPGYLLRDLRDFTERCQGRLSELLRELGWEQEGTGAAEETVVCPYDDNHRMSRSSLEKHMATCSLRKLGYSKEETIVCDPRFFYNKAKIPSVVIDKAQQFQIIRQAKERASSGKDDVPYDKSAYSSSPIEVPQNHKRVICDLTSADRLALYDYVLEETKKQRSIGQAAENEFDLFEDLAAKLNREDGQNGPKSHLEIMAEMRDYKRRRQSYRAKNVHITKKSYTEIIRDVINVHMEELSNHWRDEAHDEASSSISSSSVRRELRRSPSADSRHSGGSHRDKPLSGRRRERSRSPHSRHQSRDQGKESKRKRDRDEERHHHSHKRRK